MLGFISTIESMKSYHKYLYYAFLGIIYATWSYLKNSNKNSNESMGKFKILSGNELPEFKIRHNYGSREFYLVQKYKDSFYLLQTEFLQDKIELEYLKMIFKCKKWYKLEPGTQYFIDKHGENIFLLDDYKNNEKLKVSDVGASFQISTVKKYFPSLRLKTEFELTPAFEDYNLWIEPYNDMFFELNNKVIKSPYKFYLSPNTKFQLGALDFLVVRLENPDYIKLLEEEKSY